MSTNRLAKITAAWFCVAAMQPGQLGGLTGRSLGGGVPHPASVSLFRPEHPEVPWQAFGEGAEGCGRRSEFEFRG